MTENIDNTGLKPRYEADYGPVTTKQLVMYAGASGDFNRIHYDYPFVREAGLKNVLVHGMLTMAFAANCLTDHVGESATVSDLAARFLSPVYAGDIVNVVSEIKAFEQGVAEIELVAFVDGKKVIQGTAEIILKGQFEG